MRLSALLLAALLPAGSAAAPWRSRVRAARGVGGQPWWTEAPAERFTDQRVDHDAPLDGATWPQRYFVNSTFFDAAGGSGPVFLCVGGEGPALQPSVVVTGDAHCADAVALAAAHGALLLALEHRFYGESFPAADVSTASLRLLSSRQALADLAHFHAHATRRFRLPPDTRWVTFGGSYPGILAAWARLRFPHLITAAVASSAPVGAVLNFQGYNDVVGRAVADADVGGDAACASAVRAAFAELGALLQQPAGRRRLEQLFPVCHAADAAEDPLEDTFAAAALSEELTYLFPAQSNDPACTDPACNIAAVCAIMRGGQRDESSPLERLARLAAVALPGEGCMADGRAAAAAALADTSLEGGGERVWLWQTCTEFGFYQTCDPDSACPFTSVPWLNNVSASLDICAMAFGADVDWAARTAAAVAASNEAYGGLQPGSTRVLYVNGDVDPWSAASIAASPGADSPVIWVQGASHHAWTHPPRDTDSPQVVSAREAIFAQVTAWLAPQPPPPQGCGGSWAVIAGVGVNVALAVINALAAVVMCTLALRRWRSGDSAAPGGGDGAAPDDAEAERAPTAASQEGLHEPLLGEA